MYVICPMSKCGSPEKRDRFLEYLSKIAPVTLETEHECRAYAWFRSAEDDEEGPHHWLRGFEVYETIEANTVSHRASQPYKAFRAAVGEESLLESPSDLRFWRPTGLGFLERSARVVEQVVPQQSQYAIVYELSPLEGRKQDVLRACSLLAGLAKDQSPISTFFVLDRGEQSTEDEILIFAVFTSRNVALRFEGETRGLWTDAESHCSNRRRTTWKACGVGFIGRDQ